MHLIYARHHPHAGMQKFTMVLLEDHYFMAWICILELHDQFRLLRLLKPACLCLQAL